MYRGEGKAETSPICVAERNEVNREYKIYLWRREAAVRPVRINECAVSEIVKW